MPASFGLLRAVSIAAGVGARSRLAALHAGGWAELPATAGLVNSHQIWERPCARGLSSEPAAGDSGGNTLQHKKLLSSLMYRSKQRGFLELDLLVGLWAQRHLPSMSVPQLEAFSEVLAEENPDLFKWLTGQEQPSVAMSGNPSFMAMRDDIGRQLSATRPPECATAAGKSWLRGWDDWKKEPSPGIMELPPVTKEVAVSAEVTPPIESGKQSRLQGGHALASAAAAVGGESP